MIYIIDTETNAEDVWKEQYHLRLCGIQEVHEAKPSIVVPGTPEWKTLKETLENPDNTTIGWSNYDYLSLLPAGIKPSRYYDLKIPFRLHDENSNWGLGDAIEECLDKQNHKYLVKMWEQQGYNWDTVPFDQLIPYNKLDVYRTKELREWINQPGMYEKNQDDFLQVVNRIMLDITERGIGYDTTVYDKIHSAMSDERDVALGLLKAVADIDWDKTQKQVIPLLVSLKVPIGVTEKGNPSLTEAILEENKDKHPILATLHHYRHVNKMLSTYLEGMRACVGKDGLLHPTYSWAKTWRFRTSRPNVQNMPKKSIIRKQIVSKFKGGYLLEADFGQLELRLIACAANDKVLVDELNAGVDMHKRTGDDLYNGDRSVGKNTNFAIRYGAGPNRLHEAYGLDKNVARAWINEQYRRYPAMETYKREKLNALKEGRAIKSLTGRKRHTDSYTMAMNYGIQELGGDLNKTIIRMVHEHKDQFQSHPLWDYHDAVIFDIHPDEKEEYIDKVVRKCYNSIMDGIEEYFGTFVRQRMSAIKTWPYSMKLGKNFYNMEEIQ